ncbi:AMIN-like domain-containing (lipo)protein [Petropleomorpha daqingensis]|uniref:AMIN-like domain-containing protein n=1 Tax=Petropleomorpha daqingensis TaxID=2026353 RepID=A0A853CFC1_9ACTN|nr:hypothetical protein [Petropleomorpha daqingensis]NYJ05028.1 hypothetical protein [Petropleomorpha daqingensis]
MSRALPLTAVLLAAVLVAGCSSSDDGGSGSASGTSTTSSSSSSSSSDGTDGGDGSGSSDAPPFPANTDPDTAQASPGAQVTVSDIRTGRQNGFDRVVFEVGGSGTPGWDVRYVDAPTSQASGEPVEVGGSAALQVAITGVGLPADTGVAQYAGPNPLPGAGTTTVTEVVFDTTFEGTTTAFVGTTGRTPFRVYALSNPTRVVLEVRDA